MSTSRHLAISTSVATLGWALFVHHFDTVAGSFPIFSANHLLVRFFSTKTTLILFKSSLISVFQFAIDAKIVIFLTIKTEINSKYYHGFLVDDDIIIRFA